MQGKVSVEHNQGGIVAGGNVVSVEGLQGGGVVAGRDIIFGDSTEFFEPQLDDVKSPQYLTPHVALDLVDRLVNRRLLILGGHQMLDRETFARHLGWLLKTRLEMTGGGTDIEVRQWSREVDRGRLLASFRRYEVAAVFLLPDARPAQFGFDIRQLRDDLSRTGHYAILSSASDRDQWGIAGSAAEDSWFDAPPAEMFPRADILAFLEDRLAAERPAFEALSSASPLCGFEPEEVVSRLGTPNRISKFVISLSSSTEPLDRERVGLELDQFADGHSAIQQWYRRLSRRHQLLAMGLVLFDGLYDDQIFAALEEIMNAVWKAWEPQLSQFDFRDLEELRTYFPNAGMARQIRCRSETVRQGILEAAWALHRRHLMAALPVNIKLMKRAIRTVEDQPTATATTEKNQKRSFFGRNKPSQESSPRFSEEVVSQHRQAKTQPAGQGVSTKSANPPNMERLDWDLEGPNLELWGSEVRSAMLRDSTGEALSRLSQLSADGLDSHLRALAGDRVPSVRLVSAKALAGWRHDSRRKDNEQALFDKLREWNDRTLENEVVAGRSDVSGVEQRRRLGSIRATVAMAVGYAASYDPPDGMCGELLALFESFLEEKNPLVQQAISEVTLPLVMGVHLKQLEPLLRDGARHRTWLRRGLALGFVLALELRPDEALAIMDSWHAQSQPFAPEIPAESLARTRQNVLAALIEAYSLFSSFSQFELFGIEVVFSKFRRVLAEEKGSYLRRLTLWGALVQFRRQPARAEPLLQDLVAEATLEERADLIEGFGFVFWDQRQELEGGDASIAYASSVAVRWKGDGAQPLAWDEIVVRGSREFAVWIRSARPWLPIELMLRRWLLDESHPVAQQLALEALVELHEKEERLMTHAKSRRVFQMDWQAQPAQIRSLARSHQLPFLGRLFTYLSVSESSGMREKVLALLPQLLRQFGMGARHFATTAVLEAWKKDPDPYLARLAAHLVFTARLFGRRHWMLVLTLVLIAGIWLTSF